MPQDSAGTVYIDNVRAVPWITTILDLAQTDFTTNAALNAVALTIIGRTNSDPTLLRESTRLYAFTLRETNRALQDPTRTQRDEVLACCKVLSM